MNMNQTQHEVICTQQGEIAKLIEERDTARKEGVELWNVIEMVKAASKAYGVIPSSITKAIARLDREKTKVTK